MPPVFLGEGTRFHFQTGMQPGTAMGARLTHRPPDVHPETPPSPRAGERKISPRPTRHSGVHSHPILFDVSNSSQVRISLQRRNGSHLPRRGAPNQGRRARLKPV